MRARRLVIALALASAVFGPASVPAFGQASGEANPFDQAPVSDSALSGERGGFAVPGIGQVNIAVQSDTRVNGQLVLRTVLIAAQGAPTLTVFAKTDSSNGPTQTVSAATKSGTIVNITTNAPPITTDAPEGLAQVALAPGQSVGTGSGDLRFDKSGTAAQVVLNAPDLEVRQLVGQAFGTIVSNRGNDMTIDSSTMINIDLTGARTLSFGSAFPRLDALAGDAARFGH